VILLGVYQHKNFRQFLLILLRVQLRCCLMFRANRQATTLAVFQLMTIAIILVLQMVSEV